MLGRKCLSLKELNVKQCKISDKAAEATKYTKYTLNKKTRRGRPVDNRPSTNKLHHFVPKKQKKTTKHVTRDM